MKLERFQEKKQKRIGMIVGISSMVLLLALVIVYRTYSIYQESQEFDVIRGSVPDQNYDVMFTFYFIEEDGMKKRIETIPEGKNYQVRVECNQEASGVWDKEKWGPRITKLVNARTKCGITFEKLHGPLEDYGIEELEVTEGNGIYQVPHEDASITYTTNATAIANLKKTEYRYAGDNPNNYVKFNEELWRVIGLVNTPAGQRLKLIRDTRLGSNRWTGDESLQTNDWSKSVLNTKTLNGTYYNSLTQNSKNMIESVSWNLSGSPTLHATADSFYAYERGKSVSANVAKTWIGKVALMYPSDYGYAVGGSVRTHCLSDTLRNYNNNECSVNDWLYLNSDQWTLTLWTGNTDSVFLVAKAGNDTYNYGCCTIAYVRPVVYLKSNVNVTGGTGTREEPYDIILS